MKISGFPCKELADIPTPLSFLPRFSEAVGDANIWIKRDDQTGLAMGGNKARKLEYLVGDAQQKGADVLLTAGGEQSNHARMTAAAAAAAGMRAVLFLSGEQPDVRQGNLLLDEILNAEIRFIGEQDSGCAMQQHAEQLRGDGHAPYIIPVGGSVPVGCLGYVRAGIELAEQAMRQGVEFAHIVLAAGSGGTAAGLLLALHALSPGTGVHAVSVSREAELLAERILELTHQTADLLGWSHGDYTGQLRVHDQFVGEGYAVPTKEGLKAGHLLAKTEGILVDTTYTGKGLAGLVGLAGTGEFGPGEDVVFLHTGGVPAIFSTPDSFSFLWEGQGS